MLHAPRRTPDWDETAEGRWDQRLSREWLVTNGLGGYASGTVGGAVTRRYHGLLVAALPAPLGRTLMLNHLREEVRLADGTTHVLGGLDSTPDAGEESDLLQSFHLEYGLPVWRFAIGSLVLEKRITMAHFRNTTHISYSLVEGDAAVRLRLRPSCQFRSYEAPVSTPLAEPYALTVRGQRLELRSADVALPALRLRASGGERVVFVAAAQQHTEVLYERERDRGYASTGHLFSPGYFRCELPQFGTVALVLSTEEWVTVDAMRTAQARDVELQRRRRLVSLAGADPRSVEAELVLAADQFITRPAGRVAEQARAEAEGRDLRTIIAGYHWFTDWGRDTMIALEGLTLCTGRYDEADFILRTFAHYVRDGLLPNMFPDQSTEGLYHTADATLWFFHAADRYLRYTGDTTLIEDLLPVFRSIVQQHLSGTRFGIGVDPDDGLLRQGAEGYQLTWMDAKVDGWVVTPRRGKAVEINALWYNALRLFEGWCGDLDEGDAAEWARAHAERARESFNRRFWYEDGGYLYDVVDSDGGDDAACRPNQVFAISLDHPILDEERWRSVMEVVRDRLLTPVGLRSLSSDQPDYAPRYWGDLRSRDAAYHQGTVWGWLIGPFIDAWLRCHPDDRMGARALLDGLLDHLDEFGVGSIAEIFDAEAPFTPRGCIAQAWSVAEALRCWQLTGTAVAAEAE
jgi:predicted glycogen debranching enzyme